MDRKLGVAVLVGWVFIAGMPHQTAWAFGDSDQDQDQRQQQQQAAVAVQGQAQGQGQSQGNDQSLSTHVEGQRQNVVQSSPNLYLGNAEEGISGVSPWGNVTIGKQAEMTKIVAAHSIVSNAEDKQKLENQAVKSALRCGLVCQVSRLLF